MVMIVTITILLPKRPTDPILAHNPHNPQMPRLPVLRVLRPLTLLLPFPIGRMYGLCRL